MKKKLTLQELHVVSFLTVQKEHRVHPDIRGGGQQEDTKCSEPCCTCLTITSIITTVTTIINNSDDMC
ncbi:MAG: hypothetical protein QNK37_29220 [Acidobacteriota bacterium]|nr:hypothetical protein [Acidobacteriota bacterium]